MKKLLILSVLSASLLTAGENTNNGVIKTLANGVLGASEFVSTMSATAMGYASLLAFPAFGLYHGFTGAYNLYQGKALIQKDLDEAIERAKLEEFSGQMIHRSVGGNDKIRENIIDDSKIQIEKWNNHYKSHPINEKNEWQKYDRDYTCFAHNALTNKPFELNRALQYKAWDSINGTIEKVEDLKSEKEFNNKYFYQWNIAKTVGGFGMSALWAYAIYHSQNNKSDQK
jgi:predicted small secreted protein